MDVYSASEEVELFLNGASLGRRAMVDFTATYSVPYTPGELKAVAIPAVCVTASSRCAPHRMHR